MLNDRVPEHWLQLTGPSSWYRVWYPPSWSVEEEGACARISSSDGNGMLSLNCLWVDESTAIDATQQIAIDELFPVRRRVQTFGPADLPGRSTGVRGEAVLGPPAPWWRRMLRRAVWRRWRLWTMQQGPICLIATFLQTGPQDPELETLSAMILGTLEFAEPPADPPDVFARRVLDLAREKFPLLECRQSDEFQLQLGESSVNLFNFYRSYVNAPDSFEAIVLPALTTVVQVQEWGQSQTDPALESIRPRIMPMLYPRASWEENFANFAGTDWVAGLMVLYVVDESQAYWYIREELLEQWQLSSAELHQLALENLDAYFEQQSMDFTLVGEPEGARLLMPNRPDAYNTSRLLSAHFQRKLRELLGAEFVVGVPNRDFFVAVSLGSTETLEQVRAKVSDDFAQLDHPLSDRMLLVSADGVSEFCF